MFFIDKDLIASSISTLQFIISSSSVTEKIKKLFLGRKRKRDKIFIFIFAVCIGFHEGCLFLSLAAKYQSRFYLFQENLLVRKQKRKRDNRRGEKQTYQLCVVVLFNLWFQGFVFFQGPLLWILSSVLFFFFFFFYFLSFPFCDSFLISRDREKGIKRVLGKGRCIIS